MQIVKIWVGLTVRVRMTLGLEATPAALNVTRHWWLPAVALAVLTEALRVAGVEPEAGERFSQAQSDPRDAVKLRPDAGLVLPIERTCAAGAVPPMV